MDNSLENKIIIITKSVEKDIVSVNIPGYKIIKAKNAVDIVDQCLRDNNNQSLMFFVIFTKASEYLTIRNHLLIFNSNILYYKAILKLDISENRQTALLRDKKISNVWSKGLEEFTFKFNAANNFWLMEKEYLMNCKQRNFDALLIDMKHDQEDLINIGRSLTIIKDANRLLKEILMLSKKITEADAGSIYIVEEKEIENEKREKIKTKQIRFKFSHTFSKNIPLEEFVIPFDSNSIAGYVAVTGKVLNIPDVYQLPKTGPISFNNHFDIINDYHSKSMLVVPMRNHHDEIIGVIQLINSKCEAPGMANSGNAAFEIKLSTQEDFEKKVHAFDPRYEGLMEAVAGQAAIAVENNRMLQQIQNQFEEFVKASVMAIESRDPATSGHSFRIAEICKTMAGYINNIDKGPFADISFSDTQLKELEYAALLHDFGKVYIDLAIFMKAQKLFPYQLDNLLLKLDYLYKTAELKCINDEINMYNDSSTKNKKSLEKLEKKKLEILNKIKDIKEKIFILNKPTITDEDPKKVLDNILSEINKFNCKDINGNNINILDNNEKKNLSIKKGSLNDEERRIIESHVIHTYNFVSKIPWPHEYRQIPIITRMHHEKIDGSGYPDGKKADEIPIQAKIMAIADIYDALTATDRPYKKAISYDKAIEILEKEAAAKKVDKNLVEIFKKCKINKVLAKYYR